MKRKRFSYSWFWHEWQWGYDRRLRSVSFIDLGPLCIGIRWGKL